MDACATVDSDVLLFGAETAFHTLKPLVNLSWYLLVSTSCLCTGHADEEYVALLLL